MSNSIQDQIQEGKTHLKQGNQEQAHQIFLQILKEEPENILALLYAGASASGREEAEFYLLQAQELDPDNISIQKGLQWAQTLPSEPFKKPKIKKSREKTKNARISSGPLNRSSLLLIGGLLLFGVLLTAGLFAYTVFLAPLLSGQNPPPAPEPAVEEQAAQEIPAELEAVQSSPGALPPTWTPEPTPTQRSLPTATEVPDSPVELPSISSEGRFTSSLPPLSPEDEEYPQVEPLTLISSPDDFIDQYLQLTLPILHVGAVMVDDVNQYVLLLDPGQEAVESNIPIGVFGFSYDNEETFEAGQMITISGAGLGQIDLDNYFALGDNVLPVELYEEEQSRTLPGVAGMAYKLP